MKQPKKVNENHTKCGACNKPIHISELAGFGNQGGLKLYHSNIFCLIDMIKTS